MIFRRLCGMWCEDDCDLIFRRVDPAIGIAALPLGAKQSIILDHG